MTHLHLNVLNVSYRVNTFIEWVVFVFEFMIRLAYHVVLGLTLNVLRVDQDTTRTRPINTNCQHYFKI